MLKIFRKAIGGGSGTNSNHSNTNTINNNHNTSNSGNAVSSSSQSNSLSSNQSNVNYNHNHVTSNRRDLKGKSLEVLRFIEFYQCKLSMADRFIYLSLKIY